MPWTNCETNREPWFPICRNVRPGRSPRRFKVPGAVVIVTFNRKSNGSAIDALAAAHRQAEEELADQAEAAA
jgi:hypothetical protein